jgi:peroxiredoxin
LIRSVTALFFCMAALAPAAGPVPRPSPDFTIHLTPATQTSPKQYKGKVVLLAFIQTTCPHCQAATPILSGLQRQYGPRGLQVLAAAFNTKADTLVPGFIHQFQPNFPVGWAADPDVRAYLDHSVMAPLYVPSMVFIDRKGMIRHQFLGGDPFFNDQEKNLRETIEEMLKQPPVTAKK